MKDQGSVSRWVPVLVIAGAIAIAAFGNVSGRPFGRGRDRAAFVVMPSFVIPWLGDATVDDRVVFAPRNLPAIRNECSYTLVEIDGRRVTRVVRAFTDSGPEALVRTGSHVFRVRATPVLRHPNATTREEAFTATVERGKRYYICSSDQGPGLIEARTR